MIGAGRSDCKQQRRGPLKLRHGRALFTEPAQQVAGRFIPAELAVKRDGAVDRSGRLKRLCGRGGVV